MRPWLAGLPFALLASVASVAACADGEMRFSLAAPKPGYGTGEPIVLTWTLFNGTGRPWTVLSGEQDCDAVIVQLDTADGRTLRRFQLSVPRTAARPEFTQLAPGESLVRSFDLTNFAEINRVRLGPGAYAVKASYGFASYGYTPEGGQAPMWPGTAAAPPLRLTIGPRP